MFNFFKKIAGLNNHERKLNNKATIYVWPTNKRGVGHVAIQFEGRDGSPIYTSIWPNKFPAIGPLTIAPLKASLATQLTDDIQSESRTLPLEFDNGFENYIPSESHGEVKPDKIFVIPIPNQEAMLQEFERIKAGVTKGDIRYQLYPNVKTSSRERYNCATYTAHLLETGGVTFLPKIPVWKPSDFADVLESSLSHSPKKTFD